MKLNELYSKSESVEVLTQLKTLFEKMGFTVSYDGHALNRLLGRDKEITKEQMIDSFKFLMLVHKKSFRPMRDKKIASMIVRDSHNLGNYVINFTDNHAKIMTVIKKKNFRSDNDRQNSVVVNLGTHPSRAPADAGIRDDSKTQPTDEKSTSLTPEKE